MQLCSAADCKKNLDGHETKLFIAKMFVNTTYCLKKLGRAGALLGFKKILPMFYMDGKIW